MASQDGIVVVTGANGFVGSHVIKQLLDTTNYQVRGTVRNPSNEAKTSFLKEMPHAAERLTLVAADLAQDGSFDDAIQGAYAVIHTAARVALTAPDPQRDIIDVNVNGVKNVLTSCRQAAATGTLKTVVMTSSIAAVQDHDQPDEYVFTEADYNLSATVDNDPYPCSKYLSEKWAADFVAELPDSDKFRLAFINPGAIYGPPLTEAHLEGSTGIVRDLMTGKFPMCPRLSFPAIDVRNVAKSHLLALASPSATGRYICVENTYSMQEISKRCKAQFPDYSFPKRQLPNFLMYLTAIFDSRITWGFCSRHLSRVPQFDNARIRTDLGLTLTDFDTTLQDTCQAMLDHGMVKPK
eukprot:m.136492 g.136492  ORF g.136492 m.136492 type:complete len:352 (-) comp16024_c0_seq3:1268-2323(-)